jgi:antibiotic biosynthesis monooxygenase (ABM) superfamily enzyme
MPSKAGWSSTSLRISQSPEAHFERISNKSCPTSYASCPGVFVVSNFVNEIITVKNSIMKTKQKLLASLKIWMVIYPSITLFLFLFGEPLAALPLYLRTFILTISLVPWMMFVGVPALDLLFRRLAGNEKQKTGNRNAVQG